MVQSLQVAVCVVSYFCSLKVFWNTLSFVAYWGLDSFITDRHRDSIGKKPDSSLLQIELVVDMMIYLK